MGTETDKVRPVVIVQTDLLNNQHPSTVVCPVTTNVKPDSTILRAHLKKAKTNLKEDCDIMIDQMRAIDNKRLLKKIGAVSPDVKEKIKENLKIVLDLD